MSKAFFQPVVKMLQTEVDAGATNAPVGAKILVIDGSGNLTGQSFEKTSTWVLATGGAKNNYAATAAPAISDDAGDGYSVGSRWIDITNDESYICTDSTTGAAVWNNTTVGTIAEVAGLQSALDGKSATIHNHDTTYTAIAHATNTSNPHSTTKSQVGLGSVDNTADTAKPVSTAQQTALNGKEATANKGAANGYAGLGADARVPFAQLPESVGIGFRLWTPADLGTTRAIDLDFESAPTGALTSINNQGSLGGTADQSVVGEQPTIDTLDITGRRGCLFDGTNDSLRSSAIWSLGTTYGLFAVYRRSATGAGMLISTEYPTNVAYTIGQVQDAVNNGFGGNMVFLGHFNGAWRSTAVNSVISNAIGIFCGNFDGTNLNARLFGIDSLTAQASLSGTPSGNTRIGRRWDTAGNNYFSGRLFRIIGKSGAFTTGEMQLLEGWAAHRMGTSASLPSTHPYRNSPPIVAL